jgi:hypothetical protein
LFGLFGNYSHRVEEDTPDSLVLTSLRWLKISNRIFKVGPWLITKSRTIFNAAGQEVNHTFSYLVGEKQKHISFEDIKTIYLDYGEQVYHQTINEYHSEERVKRQWTIFLALKDEQTVTIANETTDHHAGHTLIASAQLAYWESLAARICAITEKFLVRMPAVPGRAPHTFVEIIDQIVQRRLAQSRISERSINLRSRADGELEIMVDDKIYRNLDEIDDVAVRDLIQASIDEWSDGVE